MYKIIKNVYEIRKGSAGSEITGSLTKMVLMIAFVAIASLIAMRLISGNNPELSLYSDYTGGLS